MPTANQPRRRQSLLDDVLRGPRVTNRGLRSSTFKVQCSRSERLKRPEPGTLNLEHPVPVERLERFERFELLRRSLSLLPPGSWLSIVFERNPFRSSNARTKSLTDCPPPSFPNGTRSNLRRTFPRRRLRAKKKFLFKSSSRSGKLLSTQPSLNSKPFRSKARRQSGAGNTALDIENEQATFNFPETLNPGRWEPQITYSGILNDKLHGFYRSTYKDLDGREKTLASTQFESTDARRAFPCWDEPASKAVFQVTLVVDQSLTAISNARVLRELLCRAPGKRGCLRRYHQDVHLSCRLHCRRVRGCGSGHGGQAPRCGCGQYREKAISAKLAQEIGCFLAGLFQPLLRYRLSRATNWI